MDMACWIFSYLALGTDKYPPFTLKPVDDYPASIEIPYPEKFSRGLALVKWWLLAIPHYIIIGIFCGSLGSSLESSNRDTQYSISLLAVLLIFAAVALLFSGRFHKDIFKFIVGINRWIFRVLAYVTFMTDKYPPFRLWDD